MDEPVGNHCPECGQLAVFLIGDQAFCQNSRCELLAWYPALTLAEHQALPRHEIDLSGDGGNGA